MAKTVATTPVPAVPTKNDTAKVHLPSPTKLDGSAFTTLQAQLNERYSDVILVSSDGKRRYTVIGAKPDRLGTFGEYIQALVFAANGGDGTSVSGCARHTVENYAAAKKLIANLSTATIEVTPKGRSGTNAQFGTVEQYIACVSGYWTIVKQSLDKYGASKVKTRTAKDEPEPVAVVL